MLPNFRIQVVPIDAIQPGVLDDPGKPFDESAVSIGVRYIEDG
jgi:hypothetical protein